MTPKHTPGTWGFDRQPDSAELRRPEWMVRIFSRDPGPDYDYTIAFVKDVDDATREANARLIAAAPALLEALKDRMDLWSSADAHGTSKRAQKRRSESWDRAMKAIAAAEGREGEVR